jgi:hypothetical protein
MIVFNYISENISAIKKEVKIGLMSYSILNMWEIYGRYDYYKKAGYGVNDSVIYSSDDFKVSPGWVYKIKKQMETET